MRRMIRLIVPLAVFLTSVTLCLAVSGPISTMFEKDKFRQLDELLPTPNAYRTASGAPGHEYWQQKVDYDIDVTLDDEKKHLTGSETIIYWNRSPDTLRYLWVQLDPNIFFPESHARKVATATDVTRLSFSRLKDMLEKEGFDGGCKIDRVETGDGVPLKHTIVDTMMRVDLPGPLGSGEQVVFEIDWNYAINDHDVVGGRTGYEHFKDDGNRIYEIAQWFPRLCKYSDAGGWQNKPYIGSGEFTLEFGDYRVRITAPDNHVVAATGVLQNQEEVLKPEWRLRLDKALGSDAPMYIVTPSEALENESTKPAGTKTWEFRAHNVRDFAWASSAKFIWDAAGQDSGDRRVLCMSYFPKEGDPLWSQFSTQAIQHTIDVYSRYSFDYPYPIAISVNGPVGGMEYPMICFNGPRPEKDKTYTERTKHGLISVVIHEVGHNYFPMIVNSDERQWTWMDEGLNTFLQTLAEQEWEDGYPARRGEPKNIVGYMRGDRQVPIMTNAESVLNGGSNAYAKPATALNILRESVLGRELFDFAFREYSQRWMFKHPTPADFFRTMEDASGVDLDWFFRGWFYTTEHVDIGIAGVQAYSIDTRDPEVEKERKRKEEAGGPITLTQQRAKTLEKRIDRIPEIGDFYSSYDELVVTDEDRASYEKMMKSMKDDDREILESGLRFYVIELRNDGGLVMPAVLELSYDDDTSEELRLPAEIWRRNAETFKKLVITKKVLTSVVLDPHLESADTDRSDNYYPQRIDEDRIQLRGGSGGRSGGSGNPMRDAKKAKEKAEAAAKKAAEEAAKKEAAPKDPIGPAKSAEGAPEKSSNDG